MTTSGIEPTRELSWDDVKSVLARTKAQLTEDQVPILSAGVAFFFMLSVFPLLIALVTLFGLVADPVTVEEQLQSMMRLMPASAVDVVGERLHSIVGGSTRSLGLGLAVSLGAGLWSASSGVAALIKAVDVAYDEHDTRGLVKVRAMALASTVVVLIGGGVVLWVLAGLEPTLEWMGVSPAVASTLAWLRWPALLVLVVLTLTHLYRWSPAGRAPRARWVAPGAVVAATVWLAASTLLSLYASTVGGYEATYGALAGVIVLLLWLWATAFSFLLGAELNAELARHRRAAADSVERARPVAARAGPGHIGSVG